MFVLCWFVWVQDIAIDGLVSEYLTPNDMIYGVTMQTLGQSIGPFISMNMFILLSSETFTKETFGIEGA